MSRDKEGRWMIWADGVGGFLVLGQSPWLVGGPTAERDGAICVQADLRRREAELVRSGSEYSLRRLQEAGGSSEDRSKENERNDASAKQERPLRRHDGFQLGKGVHFDFCCPHPLSASARLTVEPRFRFRPHADAILLLAETLLIGATRDCHVLAPHADRTTVLFRRGDDWFWRVSGAAAGAEARRVELGRRMEICGVSLTIESA